MKVFSETWALMVSGLDFDEDMGAGWWHGLGGWTWFDMGVIWVDINMDDIFNIYMDDIFSYST